MKNALNGLDLGGREAKSGAAGDQEKIRAERVGLPGFCLVHGSGRRKIGRGSGDRSVQNGPQLSIAPAEEKRLDPGEGQALSLKNANGAGLEEVTLGITAAFS